MTPPLPPGFLDRSFAHRGLHGDGLPENSAAAIVAAVEAGYGVEFDLQLSSDGRAMVFHDRTLDRMTDRHGPVLGETSTTLARIALGGTQETIPTLAEVLGLVAGRVPLLIELKGADGTLGPEVGALERAVAKDLAGYDGPVAVMSFNPHSVAALAKALPGRPRGLVTEAFPAHEWPDVPAERREALAHIPDAERVGAAFISHDRMDLDNPAVARLKQAGLRILCWTVRSEAEAAYARRVADAITFEGFRPDA
jgi:glycerophosphoryl diester phosphodiesterase